MARNSTARKSTKASKKTSRARAQRTPTTERQSATAGGRKRERSARTPANASARGKRAKRAASDVDRQGITNRPPEDETGEQASLPPRGQRKGGVHA